MKRQKRENICYRGKRTGIGTKKAVLLSAAVIFLLLAALCRFVLPGVKSSAVFFVCIAGVCLLAILLDIWAAAGTAGRVVRRIFIVLLMIFIVLFAVMEGWILYAGHGNNKDTSVKAVIVLGAGVNGSEPSRILSGRIDAAAEYLQEHPNIPVILSGGKGTGEDISEAQAMSDALTKRNVDSSRLILEEKSTRTLENLQYSQKLLHQKGIDTKHDTIAVVTNDFHICRTRMLAGKVGMDHTVGVPADAGWWWLSANYYIREVFALGQTILSNWI